MCVIAVCQKRRLTPREVALMDGANPHGIGVAWPDRKAVAVEYVKGLSAAEALALLPRLPLPHVVHFRFASVGRVTPALCHPFPLRRGVPGLALKGAAKAVMFHNGTWAGWRVGFGALAEMGLVGHDAEPDEATWSDSRVMAALMAGYSPSAVAEIVGGGQRLAVLHAGGRVELFGGFERHRGIQVSNLWWRLADLPALRATDRAPRKAKPAQVTFADCAAEPCGAYAPTWTPPYRAATKVPRPAWPERRR